MPRTAKDIFNAVLANATSESALSTLISPTATYTSLCYRNPALKKLMPYCGVNAHQGPKAIAFTFTTVGRIWQNEGFSIHSLFTDEDAPASSRGADSVGEWGGGESDAAEYGIDANKKKIVNLAAFGSFTYRSSVLGKKYTSPFSIWCQMDMSLGEGEEEKGRIVYMQFMEDTFGTGATFEKEGEKMYEVEPGEDVKIGIVGEDVAQGDKL